MTPFSCGRCQHTVFFENDQCGHCGAALGFVVAERVMAAWVPAVGAADAAEDLGAAWQRLGPDAAAAPPGPPLSPCANRARHGVCNWMLDSGDEQALCCSCRLNHTIPDLSQPGHLERWARVEQAQRRWFYTLLTLGLAPQPKVDDADAAGLRINILAPQIGAQTVLTGHVDGVITLNLAEADDVHRESARVAFGEPWRTLIGHLRHEGAHYLQHRWIRGDETAETRFRDAFGDERADYGQALARFHAQGPLIGWEGQFISAYASAHPHEDWAETCAHWLLVLDAVETAAAWGAGLDSSAARINLATLPRGAVHTLPVETLMLTHWLPVAQFLNSMNRSLGLRDSYPFLTPSPVLRKMEVVAELMQRTATRV